MNLAFWGVPNVSKRGTKSAVAHKWADSLHNSCRLRAPNAGERAQSKVAPKSGGSPSLHSRGQMQYSEKW